MTKRRIPHCPTPGKLSFTSMQDAHEAASTAARKAIGHGIYFYALYGYVCRCGKIHMTKRSSWNGVPSELLKRVPDELQAWAGAKP